MAVDFSSWQLWVFTILALASIYGIYKVSKVKGSKVANTGKGIAVIFLLIVALGGVYLAGWGSYIGTQYGSPLAVGFAAGVTPTPTPTPSQATPSGICAVEDTTVTLSASDKYTTAATGGSHRYKINGGSALTVSDAGTLTASPGDKIKILFMNESSTSYFSQVLDTVVPCSGTKTFSPEGGLVRNGTLTIEVFNEEGNLISDPENETLAAGDVVTLTAKLKGTYQRGFPYGGVMVVEFNGTGSGSEIDDVIVDFGGSEISVPAIYAITMSVNTRTKAYTIPAILSNQILEGSIVIDADDSNNPKGDLTDILLTFYPNDYLVNEDTGGSYDGPAIVDEDSVQTFAHASAFTLSYD